MFVRKRTGDFLSPEHIDMIIYFSCSEARRLSHPSFITISQIVRGILPRTVL